MDSTKNWNEHQVAILDDAERDEGDTLVIARAGTGKTTTMLGACERFPPGAAVAFLAFNTRIKEEVSRKAPKGVEVRTIHSLGRGALYVFARGKGMPLPDPSEDKTRRAVERLWPALFVEMNGRRFPMPSSSDLVSALISAAAFAKNTLASSADNVRTIFYKLDLSLGEDEGSPRFPKLLAQFCADVLRLLDDAVDRFRAALEYDFDDMIWLPVRMLLRPKGYDRLVVDEGQDLNPCQHALVRRARRAGGRIVLVGDDRQAIYGWRGAEENGLERFQKDTRARVLRLPVTYRCGRAIVEAARAIVPDYEAAPTNEEGAVERATERSMVERVRPGDAIVSRVNAPLLGLCLQLLKRGTRARVVGRDVGRKVWSLLADAGKAGVSTVPDLARWVSAWRARERERLEARGASTDAVTDLAECVSALSEGLATVEEVAGRAQTLFTDDPSREEVVLTSTHKAKGLEWPVVWCLADTYRRGQSVEEDNLLYVAMTRAIGRLVLVSKHHPIAAPERSDSVAAPVPAPAAPARDPGALSPAAEALLRGEKIECWVPGPHETSETSWKSVAA